MIKEFKFKTPLHMKKVCYIKITFSEESKKPNKEVTYKYKPRIEESYNLKEKFFKNIKYLDKNLQELSINIQDINNYDYIKEQRPELYEEKKTNLAIPKQLREGEYRFILLRKKDKKPLELKWESKNNYKFYDPKLLKHIESGGNYGVIGGHGNLIIVDADSEEISNLCKTLPDTFIVKSVSPQEYKKHYYFIADNQIKPIRFTKEKIGDLGDVRSVGQYVVGSNCYVVDKKKGIDGKSKIINDVPIASVSETFLRSVFKDYIDPKESTEIKDKSLYPIDTKKRSSPFIKNCNVPDYVLNNKLESGTSKNWKLFPYVIDVLNARDVSQQVYETLAKKQEHEIGAVKGWVKKAKEGKLAKTSCKKMSAYLKVYHEDKVEEICGKCPLYEKIKEEKEDNDFLISKGFNKKTNKEEFSVDIDKVSEHIENEFDIRTIYGVREETLELYKDGIWTIKGKGIIKAETENLLGSHSRNNVVSEVLEKIKRRTEISREEADNIPDYKRCVANGVLDLKDANDIKFLEHSKEYNFRYKFPMEYNPGMKCPNFMKFINETFYPEDIPAFQEWLGLHLPRRYIFKNASIFHGQKNTGKSVILNLLTIFVGGNVSGLSLQEISRGKPFDLIALKDKDANIHDDLSSSDMKSVGGFKKAVGDGYIDGELKFGDKVRFRNTAKDTNACNKIPSSGEDIDDEAYYDRILLFPIENVVSKIDMDRNLLDKITTPEELSGILNWSIEGYKRLVTNNKFTNQKSPEETKFIMVQNGNSLAKFANEVLIQEDGSTIDKETMYQVYCKWCREHKPQLSPDSKDRLGKNLTKVASFTQASSNGAKRYWLNVKLNDSYYTFSKNISNISESIKGIGNSVQNNIYKFTKPVIAVSESENKTLDTLDTISKNQCFSCKKEVDGKLKLNGDLYCEEHYNQFKGVLEK